MGYGHMSLWLVAATLATFHVDVAESNALVAEINSIYPSEGSRCGEVRISIWGENFISPVSLTPGERIHVNLTSSAYGAYPCRIEKDACTETMIVCYTPVLPGGTAYGVSMSLDDVKVPDANNDCKAGSSCSFETKEMYEIDTRLNKTYGTPDELVCAHGRIFTDIYGSINSTASNGRTNAMRTAYLGGYRCEFKNHNTLDENYLLVVEEDGDYGRFCCKPNYNGNGYLSFSRFSVIANGTYGRSKIGASILQVGAELTQLYVFETYAEMRNVSQDAASSTAGGYLLNIYGDHFNNSDARAWVGDEECTELTLVSQTHMTCLTPPEPAAVPTSYHRGNRGMRWTVYNTSFASDQDYSAVCGSGASELHSAWLGEAFISAEEFTTWASYQSCVEGIYTARSPAAHYFWAEGGKAYVAADGIIANKVESNASYAVDLTMGQSVLLQFVPDNTVEDKQIVVDRNISAYNEKDTHDAKNEKKDLRFWGDAQPESQRMVLSGQSTSTGAAQTQRVWVEASGEKAYFTLGWNTEGLNIWSACLEVASNQPLEADVKAALRSMPSVNGGANDVSVAISYSGRRASLVITFNAAAGGPFPALKVAGCGSSSSDFSSGSTSISGGAVSSDSRMLQWGGAVAPWTATSAATVEASVKKVMSAQEPGYLTAQAALNHNCEEDDEFTNQWGLGTRTSNVDPYPFSGRYSCKGASRLFFAGKTGSANADGSTSYNWNHGNAVYGSNKIMCFAFMADLKGSFWVQYREGTTYNSANLMFGNYSYADNHQESWWSPELSNYDDTALPWKTWRYRCVNLFDKLQEQYTARGNTLSTSGLLWLNVHPHLVDDYNEDLYTPVFDQVSFFPVMPSPSSASAPTDRHSPVLQNLIDNEIMRPPGHSASLSVEAVADTADAYTVTMTMEHCAHNLPLFQAFNADVSSGVSRFGSTGTLTTTRVQAASPPVAGTVQVCQGACANSADGINIGPMNTEAEVTAAVRSIDPEGIGLLVVTETGTCADKTFAVEHTTAPGNLVDFTIGSVSPLTGDNPQAELTKTQDGGMRQAPVPSNPLSTTETTPQLRLEFGNIPSSCTEDCSVSYDAASTPTLLSATNTGSVGSSATLTGTLFSTTAADNIVMLGETPCLVTAATPSQLDCTVGDGPLGEAEISVNVVGLGLALHLPSSFLFSLQPSIDSCTPSSGSTAGGQVMECTGTGFSNTSTMKIGSSACTRLSGSSTTISVRTPAGTGSGQVIALNEDGTDYSSSVTYSYTAPSYSCSASDTTVGDVAGGEQVQLQGTFLGGSDAPLLSVGEVEVPSDDIISHDNSQITFLAPAMTPGTFAIKVTADTAEGYANCGYSLTYTFRVDQVCPDVALVTGGTDITITGEGFYQQAESSNTITFNDVPCEVISVTDTQVICRLGFAGDTATITNNRQDATGRENRRLSQDYTQIGQYGRLTFNTIVPYGSDADKTVTVLETMNATSTEAKTGAVMSSRYSTATSALWEYDVGTLGWYYFHLGEDFSSIRGAVEVVSFVPKKTYMRFFIGDIEAVYNPTNMAACGSPSCPAVDASCNSATVQTDAAKEGTYYSVDIIADACTVPQIDGVTVSRDTWTVSGSGLSSSCDTEVYFRDFPDVVTVVSSATSSQVVFTTDCDLPSNVTLVIRVRVGNLGEAIYSHRDETGRGAIVFPTVGAVSSTSGSTGGGQTITVTFKNMVYTVCSAGSRRRKRSTSVAVAAAPTCAISNVGTALCVTSSIVVSGNTLTCSTPSTNAASNTVPITSNVQVVCSGGGLATVQCPGASSCTLTQQLSASPQINVNSHPLSDVSSRATTLTFAGLSNFGNGNNQISANDITITIGGQTCGSVAYTSNNLQCDASGIGSGNNQIVSMQTNLGLAWFTGANGAKSVSTTVNVVGQLSSVTPDGTSNNHPGLSSEGCAELTIAGHGFHTADTIVEIGVSAVSCPVTSVTSQQIVCTAPAMSAGSHDVVVKTRPTASASYHSLTGLTVTYTAAPTITAVSQSSGVAGNSLDITGSGFTSTGTIEVSMNGAAFTSATLSGNTITWTVPGTAAGTYPLVVKEVGRGCASGSLSFQYNLQFTSISPNTGVAGGAQTVTVTGNGFDATTVLTICGSAAANECVIDATTLTHSQFTCVTPAGTAGAACAVEVSTATITTPVSTASAYSYTSNPSITSVFPAMGGTAGGTRITIEGSGFGASTSAVSVTIDSVVCVLVTVADTQIVCDTGEHLTSIDSNVRVEIISQGFASVASTGADAFSYMYLWSAVNTWGGVSVPQEGELIVIPYGMKVLLDVSTPTLKMLLLNGGILVFENEATTDITLNAEYIFINNGSEFWVGTEEKPMHCSARITICLHGHPRSLELPIYGAKVLAVRKGKLEIHGCNITNTWTLLDGDVSAGGNTLVVDRNITGWHVGDTIGIASTGTHHSQNENEYFEILTVDNVTRTITIDGTLQHAHKGSQLSYNGGGCIIEARAEVILITRNVVFKGSDNAEWHEEIEGCDDGFDPGEFSTQTCFQGRFGDDTGSDQYGAIILIHAESISMGDVSVRIGFMELYYVGQAFRLGRYAIHFHIAGDMAGSYVVGCGLLKSFNRYTNVHHTFNVYIANNVGFRIMGGAMFLEDGVEYGNTFYRNVLIMVISSTSLQNDDITPAAYWITNANNTWVENRAAGGTHFGFWFRMHSSPDGASASMAVAGYNPENIPLGLFEDNVVHSQGWFGIWLFEKWTPQDCDDVNCQNPTGPKQAILKGTMVWNCEKGIELVGPGAIQIQGGCHVNNFVDALEVKLVMHNTLHPYDLETGILINGTTTVAVDSALGTIGSNPIGIKLPQGWGLNVINTVHVGYDGSKAVYSFNTIQGTTMEFNGGFIVYFSNINFVNSPNIVHWRWHHDGALIDLDGSFGNGSASSSYAMPNSGYLDPAHCTHQSGHSSGPIPGALCDAANGEPVRFAFNHYHPNSLEGKEAIMSTINGFEYSYFSKKSTTHKMGWRFVLPVNHTYWFDFEDSVVHNFSYEGVVYNLGEYDWLEFEHPLTQRPDRIALDSAKTFKPMLSALPAFPANDHGDWYIDQQVIEGATQYNTSYLVRSHRDRTLLNEAWQVDSKPRENREVIFDAQICFYPNCEMPPDPATSPPFTGRPAAFEIWNSQALWKSNREFPNDTTQFSAWRASDPNLDATQDLDTTSLPGAGHVATVSWGTYVVFRQTGVTEIKELIVTGGGAVEIEFASSAFAGRKKRSTTACPQGTQMTLRVRNLIISGGYFIAGWGGNNFMQNCFTLEVTGNPYDAGPALFSRLNMLPKTIGVYGGLNLNGKEIRTLWTRLAATADARTSLLTLNDAPLDWVAGGKVMISASSYSPYEGEVREIASVNVNAKTVTLTAALTYRHIGVPAEKLNAASGETFHMAAKVSYLTRSIVVRGQDYSVRGQTQDSEGFGGHIECSSYVDNAGNTHSAYCNISNVEFTAMGKEGYTDSFAPGMAITMKQMGTINQTQFPTRFYGNAFHHIYNGALGVFGSGSFKFEWNTVYDAVTYGLYTDGATDMDIFNNLIAGVWYDGTWNGRTITQFTWDGAMHLNRDSTIKLVNNTVAGCERTGYRTDGESYTGAAAEWSNNEAHSCLIGYGSFPDEGGDGSSPVTIYNGFTTWRNVYYGAFVETPYSIRVANHISVDEVIGLSTFVYGPDSTSHAFEDKYVKIYDSFFVGKSSSYDGSYDNPQSFTGISTLKRFSSVAKGGYVGNNGTVGLMFPTFTSGDNAFATMPLSAVMSYPTIYGNSTVRDTHFRNFGKANCTNCASAKLERDYAIGSNFFSYDNTFPLYGTGITGENVESDSQVYMSDPPVSNINPSDCVDMDCDGNFQTAAIFKDSPMFANKYTVFFPVTEKEWGGDPRRGRGDYRIPTVMQTFLNGSRISPATKLRKGLGIYKGAEMNCDPRRPDSAGNCYKCQPLDGEDHALFHLHMESMDSDTESRRVSPIGVLANVNPITEDYSNAYMDLVNGPMDHGWCMGYTCQLRLSLFPMMLPVGYYHHIVTTGTTPQGLRFHMSDKNTSHAVTLGIHYSSPLELRVHYGPNGAFVPPLNAQLNAQGQTILVAPDASNPGQYMPSPTDATQGPCSNYFDQYQRYLYVKLQGQDGDASDNICEIKTAPTIVVAFGMPTMTVSEFFDPANIVTNMAAFLSIPASKIRVANAQTAALGKRRKRQLEEDVTYIIIYINNPARNLSDGAAADDLTAADFEQITQSIIDTYQLGEFAEMIGVTEIVEFSVIEPLPDTDTDAWQIIAAVGSNLTAEIQVPSTLSLEVEPVPIHEGAQFELQPSLAFYDASGDMVTKVGSLQTPWEMTATLVNVNTAWAASVQLTGSMTVGHNAGYFNFTDLAVSHSGTYRLQFDVTNPSGASSFSATSADFEVGNRELAAGIVNMSSSVIVNEQFDIVLEIIDNVTREKVEDIAWKGHSWEVSASMYMPATFNAGSLSGGSGSVSVDASTGLATVTGLSFNAQGRYFLKFDFTSTPGDYDFSSGAQTHLDVYNADYQMPTVDYMHQIQIRFMEAYIMVEGLEAFFAGALHNQLWEAYESVLFANYVLSNGSIIVEFEASGSDSDLEAMLKDLYSKVSAGIYTLEFDGTVYTAEPLMYVNGEEYGEDDDKIRLHIAVIILLALFGALLVLVVVGFLLYKYCAGRGKKGFELEKREPMAKRRGVAMDDDDYYKVNIPEDNGSSSSLSSTKGEKDDDKLILSQAPASTAHFNFNQVRPRTHYKAPNLLPPLDPRGVSQTPTSARASDVGSRPVSTTFLQLNTEDSTLSTPSN